MSALEVSYSTNGILLTLGLPFIGGYASVALCEQYRLATLSSVQTKRYFVLFLVATSMGWACTWCGLCCSLSAITLKFDGTVIPIRYNRGLLIVAAFTHVFQVYLGLLVSSSDPCFNNTRKEIMEKFISRASNTYTLLQIKKMSKFRVLFIVCTHSLERLNIGGIFAGIGIPITMYIILLSMQFQGKIHYNAGVAVAASILGMMNGTGGFWIFFRFLSIFPSLDFLRIIVAVMAIVTVCGVHFVGMAAITFQYDPDASPPTDVGTISQGDLYTTAVASSVIFVIIMLIFAMSDLRAWLLCTSTQLRQADRALNALMKRTEQQQLQLQQLQQANTTSSTSSSRPSTLHRTPSEVLRYSRRFLSSKNFLNTATSSANSLATTSIKEVRSHSMFNDYEDEDEMSDHENSTSAYTGTGTGRNSGIGIFLPSSRKVSIHRSDSFSSGSAGHNLADLENQKQNTAAGIKVKPQQALCTAAAGRIPSATSAGAVPTNIYATCSSAGSAEKEANAVSLFESAVECEADSLNFP